MSSTTPTQPAVFQLEQRFKIFHRSAAATDTAIVSTLPDTFHLSADNINGIPLPIFCNPA
jgi:hypothetical protein